MGGTIKQILAMIDTEAVEGGDTTCQDYDRNPAPKLPPPLMGIKDNIILVCLKNLVRKVMEKKNFHQLDTILNL